MIRQFAERLVIVVKQHTRSYDSPLRALKGEQLTVSPRTSEWPGWIWCTSASGRSGWVPELYVERDGDTAVLLEDYDATELSVTAGESLTMLNRVAGWAWCRNAAGGYGWVPDDCLAF